MYSGDECYGDEVTSPLEMQRQIKIENDQPSADDCECLTCDGRGGALDYDSDGDGAWAMTFTRLDPCPDCLGANKCPGCGAQYLVINLNTFTCACGWTYDEDRFAWSGEDEGY